MEIKEISFEEILDVWVKKLWPGRIAIIEPVSAINQNGLIDCKILSFEAFFFWGLFKKRISWRHKHAPHRGKCVSSTWNLRG